MCIPLPPYAIRAGPRRTIYYDPGQVTAAVVTCGGLCPGLNDVVQNIVYTLLEYGVPEDQIYGIRYGLRGFYDRTSKPILLSPSVVDGIHLKGGTILVGDLVTSTAWPHCSRIGREGFFFTCVREAQPLPVHGVCSSNACAMCASSL